MGDLVRFWYAAFFLFASAYTLVEGGHVRVDVLYARVTNRKKAWVNALGSLVLGLPVCWTILHYGLGSRQSSLIAPILSFETSPSGYGMYVKYLMAAFLVVFAVSMALIFVSYFLKNCAFFVEKQTQSYLVEESTNGITLFRFIILFDDLGIIIRLSCGFCTTRICHNLGWFGCTYWLSFYG